MSGGCKDSSTTRRRLGPVDPALGRLLSRLMARHAAVVPAGRPWSPLPELTAPRLGVNRSLGAVTVAPVL